MPFPVITRAAFGKHKSARKFAAPEYAAQPAASLWDYSDFLKIFIDLLHTSEF